MTFILYRGTATSYLCPDVVIEATSLPAAKRIATRRYAVGGYDMTLYRQVEGYPQEKLAVRHWCVSADGTCTFWGKWEDFI